MLSVRVSGGFNKALTPSFPANHPAYNAPQDMAHDVGESPRVLLDWEDVVSMERSHHHDEEEEQEGEGLGPRRAEAGFLVGIPTKVPMVGSCSVPQRNYNGDCR